MPCHLAIYHFLFFFRIFVGYIATHFTCRQICYFNIIICTLICVSTAYYWAININNITFYVILTSIIIRCTVNNYPNLTRPIILYFYLADFCLWI